MLNYIFFLHNALLIYIQTNVRSVLQSLTFHWIWHPWHHARRSANYLKLPYQDVIAAAIYLCWETRCLWSAKTSTHTDIQKPHAVYPHTVKTMICQTPHVATRTQHMADMKLLSMYTSLKIWTHKYQGRTDAVRHIKLSHQYVKQGAAKSGLMSNMNPRLAHIHAHAWSSWIVKQALVRKHTFMQKTKKQT